MHTVLVLAMLQPLKYAAWKIPEFLTYVFMYVRSRYSRNMHHTYKKGAPENRRFLNAAQLNATQLKPFIHTATGTF